jgi:hypothetical protein
MVKPLAALLYFFTALATLNVGVSDFNSMYSVIWPKHFKALASIAILDFGVPTIFLLASITVFWTSDKSRAARWITAAAVLMGLMPVFIHHRLAWKPLLEAAGTLISAVFIVGSLVRKASIIAGWGTVFYAVLQGPFLILQLHFYWAFGGSVQHLLMIFVAPALVAASLVMAAYSHVRTRDVVVRAGPTH